MTLTLTLTLTLTPTCGEKLTQKTKFACPRSVLSILPEPTLHTW